MEADWLRAPIIRRVRAATGLYAAIDSLSLSPFQQALDLRGMALVRPDASPGDPPLLTVARIQADVSLRQALRGEIRLRSLVIHHPVLHLDGLPPRPPRPDTPAAQQHASGLSFVLDRLLVMDGEAVILLPRENEAGVDAPVRLALRQLNAEVTRDTDHYRLDVSTDDAALHAPDPVSLAPSSLSVTLDAGRNLASVRSGRAEAGLTLCAGSDTPLTAGAEAELTPDQTLRFALQAVADVSVLIGLAPAMLPPGLAAARGQVSLEARGSIAPDRGVEVENLLLSARNVSL